MTSAVGIWYAATAMRAITIHQPWAWAIVSGAKRVENRTWATRYRGPLLIHAGKSTRSLHCWPTGIDPPPSCEFVFGALLGTVDLVDCVPLDDVADDPFAAGPWCWVLESPQALALPIPYPGRQGLFVVPEERIETRRLAARR